MCQAEEQLSLTPDGFLSRHSKVSLLRVPRSVIRALLLIAGVEQNPGLKFPCVISRTNCKYSCLQCTTRKNWCHFKCANVDLYTARGIYWYCSTCKVQPQANLTTKTAPKADIKLLQLNINGLRSKTSELALLLHSNKVVSALIQETKMAPKPSVRR